MSKTPAVDTPLLGTGANAVIVCVSTVCPERYVAVDDGENGSPDRQ